MARKPFLQSGVQNIHFWKVPSENIYFKFPYIRGIWLICEVYWSNVHENWELSLHRQHDKKLTLNVTLGHCKALDEPHSKLYNKILPSWCFDESLDQRTLKYCTLDNMAMPTLKAFTSSTAPFIVPGMVHYGSCPLDGSVLTWEKCRTEMLHINFYHKDLI